MSKAELVQHVTAHFFTPHPHGDRGGDGFEPNNEQQIIDEFVMAVRQRSTEAGAEESGLISGKLRHQPQPQQAKVKKSKPAVGGVKPKKTKKSKRIGRVPTIEQEDDEEE